MDKDKAIRSAKLTAAGILDKARARTAVTRAGGQIAPSKYLPNVPRQVHADGGRENGRAAFLSGNHPDVPDVVYHGTGADIKSFDRSKIGQGQLGFHFGNKEAARSITDTRQSASTMPVHLSLKNPIRLQDHGHWDMSSIYGDLSKSKKFRQEDLDNFLDREQDGNVKNNELADFIQAHGYDGVVYTNRGEGLSGKDVDHMHENNMDSFLDEMPDEEFRQHFPSASDSFIVFHPHQIKSAIGNQGTFDPNDPDITKAEGGSVTDTDEFRNWFRNSATHTDGDPHVLYTGTSKDKDFTSFNVGRHGAWFTRDPAEASEYAERNDSQGYKQDGWKLTPINTASRVIPAYVRAENPYTGDLPDEVLRDNYKKAQSDWFDTLRRKGHDSWIPARHNGDLVVVLKEPQQIKSIFNNGKFDPNQKHMNKAGGGAALALTRRFTKDGAGATMALKPKGK